MTLGHRCAALAASAALLAGCASDAPKPAPLESYTPKIAARLVWSVKLGGGGSSSLPGFGWFSSPPPPTLLSPAVRGDTVFVATPDGDVAALALDSGAVRWRASVGTKVSAGAGSDGRHTSVVTRANEVVTFDGDREVWRKRVPSAVVTPPLVAGERVFVMGVDRAVHAFDAVDGRRLWSMQRPGDALTLAQPGVLTVVGQGPRLAGIDPLRGTLRWEVSLASPRGTNEVERLADLVGPAARVGDRLCARAFQAAVACADAARGVLLWTRNLGGTDAVAADGQGVFGADASDRVSGWSATTGDVLWTHENLLRRGLGGALAVGPVVVFGDAEGYVHFLSTASGELQLRAATDGTPIHGAPVAAGGTLLVTTQGGGLFAFRPE